MGLLVLAIIETSLVVIAFAIKHSTKAYDNYCAKHSAIHDFENIDIHLTAIKDSEETEIILSAESIEVAFID